MTAPTRAPVVLTTASTPVPHDLIASVGGLAGFGVIRFVGNQPLYDDTFVDGDGEMHPVECEFSLPHACQRIMTAAPALSLTRTAAGYACSLKAGQPTVAGASLVEAVFRAYVAAKAQRGPLPKAA